MRTRIYLLKIHNLFLLNEKKTYNFFFLVWRCARRSLALFVFVREVSTAAAGSSSSSTLCAGGGRGRWTTINITTTNWTGSGLVA